MAIDKVSKIRHFLSDDRVLLGLWIVVGLASALSKIAADAHNNFMIFRGVFWHTWNQTTLYGYYPGEYADCNHYGPLFSLVIAPFALVPPVVGLVLWGIL